MWGFKLLNLLTKNQKNCQEETKGDKKRHREAQRDRKKQKETGSDKERDGRGYTGRK